MLHDVYVRLLLHRASPRWINGELHVEVLGRRFTLVDHPNGVAVRTLAATAAVVFESPEEALAGLGLSGLTVGTRCDPPEFPPPVPPPSSPPEFPRGARALRPVLSASRSRG